MFAKTGLQLSQIHDELRLGKDKAFRPLIKILPRWLSPNQVTLFRFVMVLIWLPFAVFKPVSGQILIFFIIYFLDLLDGAIARFRNKITYFGHYFDHFSDRINHACLYIVLLFLANYQLTALKFLIGLEILLALLLVVEYFLKNNKFAHTRVLFQFSATVVLWAVLIYEVNQVYGLI